MQRVAQDWLVLTELTDNSGIAVGIVTALQFAPSVVLTPFAGVLADRVDTRKLLIATQTARWVCSPHCLGGLVLLGHAQLWHVYVLALALGVVSAFDAPARQMFVSELVPADRLANAVSLNSASFNAARLIGPGHRGSRDRGGGHGLGLPAQRRLVRRHDRGDAAPAHLRAADGATRAARARSAEGEGCGTCATAATSSSSSSCCSSSPRSASTSS